jgi:hypothetical protein
VLGSVRVRMLLAFLVCAVAIPCLGGLALYATVLVFDKTALAALPEEVQGAALLALGLGITGSSLAAARRGFALSWPISIGLAVVAPAGAVGAFAALLYVVLMVAFR